MQLRPIDPVAKRRRMMLFANNGGSGLRQALLDGAPFLAELTHSLVLSRGTGSPTFTRASTATFTDWEGVLRTVPSGCARFDGARMVRNLITGSSEDWTNAYYSKQALGTGTPPAVTANYAANPLDGAVTASRVVFDIGAGTTGGDASRIYNNGGVSHGANSLRSLYVKSNTQDSYVVYWGLSGVMEFKTITPQWTRLTSVVADNYPDMYLVGNLATSKYADISVYGEQIENVTGQADQTASEYVSVGVLSAPYHGAGVDGVKFFNTDRDGAVIPAATNTGYLAEGARTNLLTYSQDFDNAAWTKGGSTVTANATTAPDGTLTADKIITTSVVSSVYQATTGTAQSVCAKQAELTWIAIVDAPGAAGAAWFNLAAGVVGVVQSGYTASVEQKANGFYRCYVKKNDGSAFAFAQYFPVDGDGSLAVDGSGTKGVYVWGAQSEIGSSASTYIPTTTAAVTRAADVLTYPLSGNILDAKGWCYAEVTAQGLTPGFNNLIVGDANAGSYPLYLKEATSKGAIYDGATEFSFGDAFSVPITTPMKVASTYGGASMSGSVSGSVVGSGAFDGVMNITNIGIGHYGGAGQIFGTIRNVRIGQRQLSASELQAITS